MSVLPVTKNIRKIKIDFLFFALIRKIPLHEKHAISEVENKNLQETAGHGCKTVTLQMLKCQSLYNCYLFGSSSLGLYAFTSIIYSYLAIVSILLIKHRKKNNKNSSAYTLYDWCIK